MAYLEILQKHNADLGGLIEKANSLPEKGDLGKQVDAFIDGSITEVDSTATSGRDYTFYNNQAVTRINLPNATSIGTHFVYNCMALTSINLPSATSIGGNAFTYCSALTNVDFPQVTSIGSHAFDQCYKLASVKLPKLETVDALFGYCTALKSVDLPKATTIKRDSFTGCRRLKSVILRNRKVCSLAHTNAFQYCYHILGTVDSTINPTGAKDGYFYVPRALVDSYKVATNWSTFSTQFRALEDYTVDGTITGALDPNKI